MEKISKKAILSSVKVGLVVMGVYFATVLVLVLGVFGYESYKASHFNKTSYVSSSIEEATERLSDKYGITVHLNEEITNISADMVIDYEYDEELAIQMLDVIYDELSRYNDETIDSLYKDWYIVKNIEADNNGFGVGAFVQHGENLNKVVFSTDPISIDKQYLYQAIHHELFHIITREWTDDEKDAFDKIEVCSDISDYACENLGEKLSVAWGLQMSGQKTTESGEYLINNYSTRYLRMS